MIQDKNYLKEMMNFPKFAKDYGVQTSMLANHVENSMTPYIIEERPMNVAQIDVFSRLMAERIIWLAGPVTDAMSTVAQAQLMFLDSLGAQDITLHIDTPGGSVKSGLSIIDVMDYVKSDIITINTGMAASMGSVLLGAGTKGKRFSLRFSTTMLHRSSGGIQGNIQDAQVTWEEWQRNDKLLFELLGKYSGKTADQVKEDSTRDKWLTADQALAYGLIDEIITKKK